MDNNPKSNHRRSIRLREYDYSQPGAYFITIVSYQRKNLFGHIIDGEMILNQAGEIVEKTWLDISKHFPNARCDIYVIMPNHLHGIIEIIENGPVGARNASHQPNQTYNNIEFMNDKPVGATHESPLPKRRSGPKPKSIGVMVGLFKAAVTKQLLETGKLTLEKIWQRNYYEHIIRNEDDYQQIADYIESNPTNWEYDQENPDLQSKT